MSTEGGSLRRETTVRRAIDIRIKLAVVMAAAMTGHRLWLTAAPGWAHHAFSAEFDASQSLQGANRVLQTTPMFSA